MCSISCYCICCICCVRRRRTAQVLGRLLNTPLRGRLLLLLLLLQLPL
jgi:hypothetical protein